MSLEQKPVKKSWPKVLGIGCGGLLLLFIVIGIVGGIATSQDGTTSGASAKSTAAKSAKWVLVATFKGDSTKTTPNFTVGNEWKIKWDTKPGKIGDGNFAINIEGGPSGIPDVAANVIGANVDESYKYEAGTYHLSILSMQPYVIEIWDKQ